MRTGQRYLDALTDDRDVWLHGQQVKDVRSSPFFSGPVAEVAAIYDMQHRPELTDVLTYVDGGVQSSRAFELPRSAEDLARRGAAYRSIAEASYGMLGRSPDYMHTCLASLYAHADFFGEYADNIRAYYHRVRKNDLFVTHSFTNPQTDRSRSLGELGSREMPIALQYSGSTAEGIVVRGARMMATSAHIADELLIAGAGRLAGPDDQDIAIAFAVPVATKGLRLICRESYAVNASGDRPLLASRFDEMDAVAVFDDVVVPWERVFVLRDPRRSNDFKAACRFFENVGQQVLTRQVVKGRFILSVAAAVAQTIGVIGFPPIVERLGRMSSWVDVTEGCLAAAIAAPEADGTGVVAPQSRFIHAGLRHFTDHYTAAIAKLEEIGAGGLILTPANAEKDPDLAADVAHYFQGAGIDGLNRVRLFRLAWELTGSSFASRESLFERYFLGEPGRAHAAGFNRLDLGEVRAAADQLLRA